MLRSDAVHVHLLLSADGLEVCDAFNFHFIPIQLSAHNVLPFRVIVYDRFGLHHAEVKSLLSLPGVDYYPFSRT